MEEINKTGFGSYTFSDDARKTPDKLMSLHKETRDLLYWVESGSMVLIKGPKNSGKTRLAFEVIENFKGEGKVIYIDLETYNKEIDIGHLIIGNQSLFRKLRNKMPKGMILVIDNAHKLDNDFYRRLQFFFDQGYLKSVIFVKKSDSELDLPESVKSRIGEHLISLNQLSKEECLEIVSSRVGSLFTKEQLKKVWEKSSDFTGFLENCKKVVDTHSEKENEKTVRRRADAVVSICCNRDLDASDVGAFCKLVPPAKCNCQLGMVDGIYRPVLVGFHPG